MTSVKVAQVVMAHGRKVGENGPLMLTFPKPKPPTFK